jgi:hypothetical protein
VFSYDHRLQCLRSYGERKSGFTGAETEFMEHYNLSEKVCVNALNNVDYLIKELSFLIENPDEIRAIGRRARQFVEHKHDYKKNCCKYLDTWEQD